MLWCSLRTLLYGKCPRSLSLQMSNKSDRSQLCPKMAITHQQILDCCMVVIELHAYTCILVTKSDMTNSLCMGDRILGCLQGKILSFTNLMKPLACRHSDSLASQGGSVVFLPPNFFRVPSSFKKIPDFPENYSKLNQQSRNSFSAQICLNMSALHGRSQIHCTIQSQILSCLGIT